MLLSDLETSLPTVSHKHGSVTSKKTQGFHTYRSTAQRLCQLQGKLPGFVQGHKLEAWSRAPGPTSTWQKWQLGSGVHLQRGWWLVYFTGRTWDPNCTKGHELPYQCHTGQVGLHNNWHKWNSAYMEPHIPDTCPAIKMPSVTAKPKARLTVRKPPWVPLLRMICATEPQPKS